LDGFEILATVTGLFLGYWLVSYLLNRGGQEDTANNSQQEDSRQTFQEEKHGSEEKSWYEVLEVPKGATFDEASTAYKRRISKYHPDKVNSLGEEFKDLAEKKAKEINAAYDQAKRHFGYK